MQEEVVGTNYITEMMSGNPSSWWSGNNSMQNLMRTPSTHDQQEQTPPHDRPTHPPSLLSQQHQQQTTTSILFPSIQHDDQYVVHASSDDAPPPTDLHDGYHNHATAPHHQFPMSWSQLLLGGLVNEEERYGTPQSAGHDQINQSRKLIENCSSWETQQYLNNITTTTTPMPNIDQADHHLHIKQEGTQPLSGNTLLYNHHHLDHQDHRQDINVHEADQGAAAGATSYNRLLTTNWPPHIISPPSSSPKSCVTSSLSSSSTTNNAAAINNNNNSNILDFSNNKSSLGYDDDQKNIQHADHSYECNSSAATTTGSGGAATKKARVQPSSTPPLKVRKEKLGDRITALHQLVSPFGKTDTASVLLEAIGYIRFLQGQIEALSSPYLSNSPAKTHQQQSAHAGERNCLFPDHPGQLLNDSCLKRRGAADSKDYNNKGAKDLKSRGLCLVPISYTHMVGNDNGADYWAPSFGGGF